MSEAVLDAQARGQEASSEYKSLDDDDVERNADLYILNHVEVEVSWTSRAVLIFQ